MDQVDPFWVGATSRQYGINVVRYRSQSDLMDGVVPQGPILELMLFA